MRMFSSTNNATSDKHTEYYVGQDNQRWPRQLLTNHMPPHHNRSRFKSSKVKDSFVNSIRILRWISQVHHSIQRKRLRSWVSFAGVIYLKVLRYIKLVCLSATMQLYRKEEETVTESEKVMGAMKESPRSPEAKLGMQVEDLWDVQEPQLSPTEKLNACFESIPVSAFPQAASEQGTGWFIVFNSHMNCDHQFHCWFYE